MPTCKTCGSHFANIFNNENYDQGYRCSATVFMTAGETFLVGHYGSTIADGYLYDVKSGDYKLGMICDDCIQKGVDAGHFSLRSENNYFDVMY